MKRESRIPPARARVEVCKSESKAAPEGEKPKKKAPPPPIKFPIEDDKVYLIEPVCRDVLDLSVDTFQRECKAGRGPKITHLSLTRRGIRGKDLKTWLDGRAKAPA
jgi:hypothetical protein